MVDMFQNLFTVLNTVSTVANAIDKFTEDRAPKENRVEVVERPVVVPSDHQNTPPININLTINVYKQDADALGLPLLVQDKNGATINLK